MIYIYMPSAPHPISEADNMQFYLLTYLHPSDVSFVGGSEAIFVCVRAAA